MRHKDTVIYSRGFVGRNESKGRAILRVNLMDLVKLIDQAVDQSVHEGTINVTIELRIESEG